MWYIRIDAHPPIPNSIIKFIAVKRHIIYINNSVSRRRVDNIKIVCIVDYEVDFFFVSLTLKCTVIWVVY